MADGSRTKIGELAEQIWTAREARQVLSAWRASGLSIAGFARRHGLTPRRVSWWRKRLGEWAEPVSERRPSDHRAIAPAIVPAVVAGTVEASGSAVIVRVGGAVVLEVVEPALVAPAWLSAVIVELSGRSA
jgi:hypothetical protein